MGEIHVLKVNEKPAPPGTPQPAADEATRRLFEATSGSIVRIESENGTGSGFSVLSPELIVTDYHCIFGRKEINVRTPDGKLYRARIKDIDDVNDLALLEIVGDKPSLKPLQLGDSTKLQEKEKVAALGHPKGWSPVYISPGVLIEALVHGEKAFEKRAGVSFKAVMADPNISEPTKKDLTAIKDRVLLGGEVRVFGGSSGGPLVDAAGKVVGITDLGDPDAGVGFFTPSSDLQKMLDRTAPKFNAPYQIKGADWTVSYRDLLNDNPIPTLLGTGVLAGGSAWAVTSTRKAVSWMPGALGLAGGLMAVDDLMGLRSATSNADRLHYGIGLTGDLTILGGGLMRNFAKPVLSETTKALGGRTLLALEGAAVSGLERQALRATLSRTGKIGAIVLGAGIAIKLASDFVPNRLVHTDILRNDPVDQRPPLMFWTNK